MSDMPHPSPNPSPNPGPNLIRVSDPGDPRLEVYRDQKDAWLRAKHNPAASGDVTGTGLPGGLFMAESELVVRELLASGFSPESVLISEARLESMRDALEALTPTVPVYVAPREVMKALAGFDLHRGVLAAGRRGAELDAFELARRSSVMVVMEDLANHDNVGGIFRSVGVLVDPDRHGQPAVLLSPRCCDPLYRKALRVSIAQALRVPFATLDPWRDGLRRLMGEGVRLVALTPSSGARPLHEISRSAGERIALLVGAEGPGLSPETLDLVPEHARIEQRAGADSLNVTVACSIALHQILAC